jgi:hypothetical protein
MSRIVIVTLIYHHKSTDRMHSTSYFLHARFLLGVFSDNEELGEISLRNVG